MTITIPETYLVLDTETASFAGPICEIAIKRVRVGEGHVKLLHTLVDPDCIIDDSAAALHGLEWPDDFLEAPGQAEVAEQVIDVLMEHDGVPVLAYNAKFDRRMVEQMITNAGLDALYPKVGWVDVIRIAKAAWPGLGSYSLESVLTHIGAHNTNPHRAYADVEATILVIEKARSALSAGPAAAPAVESSSLDAIATWSPKTPQRNEAALLDKIVSEATEAVDQVKEFVENLTAMADSFVVTDDASHEDAVRALQAYRALKRKLDKTRKNYTANLNAAKRSIDALFRPLKNLADKAADTVEKEVGRHVMKMREERLEQQRLEEQRAAAEAAALEKEAREVIGAEGAQEVASAHHEAQLAAIEDKTARAGSIKTSTASTKVEMTVVIESIDMDKLPRQYMVADRKKIERVAKQSDTVQIPGVVLRRVPKVRTYARGSARR